MFKVSHKARHLVYVSKLLLCAEQARVKEESQIVYAEVGSASITNAQSQVCIVDLKETLYG